MRGESDPEDEIERLVALRLHVGELRRSLASHRPLLLSLAHPEADELGDAASARRFELLVERYEQTLQGARDAREHLWIIRRPDRADGTPHEQDHEDPHAASVIFLPGALIAGIMGMNFQPGVFSHPSLFWVTIAVIISISLATVATARARDWI